MKQQEIIDGNKLIAEFMDDYEIRVNVPFVYEKDDDMPTSGNVCYTHEDAEEEVRLEIEEGIINSVDVMVYNEEYHSSWNMLMPVVEKIETIGGNVCIDFLGILKKDGLDRSNVAIHYAESTNKMMDKQGFDFTSIKYSEKITMINATWLAVVEFIKWYNKNK